ncbi:MAG: tRNA epoxyqueuosine(34) reductase QueG [Planctomycetaceae bacterium]|nr:tRNA epoxyqueuosine(34) reductase QueG [Planctomycetaceae bacterium]
MTDSSRSPGKPSPVEQDHGPAPGPNLSVHPPNCSATVSFTDAELKQRLKERARDLGFDLCGIAPAVTPTTLARFEDWLGRGFAGEMHYLERRRDAYAHPEHVLAGVRSVIVLAMNYRTVEPPSTQPGEARVARYAWGTVDYHDLIRARLRELSDVLHKARPGCRTRGAVDTAPLLERDFARLAGLGWFGKNTMLINRRLGSWLFLAALLTDVELTPDAPHETAHCGTCTRCLDACPTSAFPEPYVLDATRCISYLTIELRTPIPDDLRPQMDNWIFGCDICNEVCPWNHKAPATSEPAFQPQAELVPLDARVVLAMSPDEFRETCGSTPLARPGLAGLQRNAAAVVANASKPSPRAP